MLNRLLYKDIKVKKELEYKDTRIKIYNIKEYRPVIGLYYIVN